MPTRLLIAIPSGSSYIPGLIRATTYLKIQTEFFDSRTHTFIEKLFIGLTGKTALSEKLLNDRLVNKVKSFQPDILLVMKGELINLDALNQINILGTKTVNWFPDYINAFELAKKMANMYDYFFHFDPLATRNLKKLNLRAKIFCLPFCSDVLPNDPKPSSKKYKYEVTFVGNYYPIREKYLESVADLGLNVWGDKRWADSSIGECYRGGQLPTSKFAEIARASKININIQHEYPCEGMVLRPFEILGAQSFLLTQYKKQVRQLFYNIIPTFSSPSELKSKVLHYLSNEKLRKSAIRNEFGLLKKRHTYVYRLKSIFKMVESTNGK